MTSKKIAIWALALLVALLTAGILVPLWWWALFGMSEQVGTAFVCTVFFLAVAIGALLMYVSEVKE